jgi:hypothetical protein
VHCGPGHDHSSLLLCLARGRQVEDKHKEHGDDERDKHSVPADILSDGGAPTPGPWDREGRLMLKTLPNLSQRRWESLGTISLALFLIFRLLLSIRWGGLIALVVGALRLGSMMQGKVITGELETTSH